MRRDNQADDLFENSPLIPTPTSESAWSRVKRTLTSKVAAQIGLAAAIIGIVVTVLVTVIQASQSGEPERNVLGIVGGKNAIAHEFPSIAVLRVGRNRWSRRFTCGATIISPSWVLTAGHCVAERSEVSYYDLAAGKQKLYKKENSEQNRSVEKIVIHPQYSGEENENDMALIKVSQPFEFNANVRAAELPDSDFRASGNLTVIGWGSIFYTGPTSDTLQKAKLPFVDDENCRDKSTSLAYRNITEKVICAGYNAGTGPCNGDSGGPLLQIDAAGVQTVVGVTSWGVGCAGQGTPSVFMETAYFVDWIRDTAGL